MDTKELRKRLRKLGNEANERFPYLNYGGCCVFAAAVAGELERLGVEYEVIVPGDKNTDLAEVRNNVRNVAEKEAWNKAGIYFSHVAVRLKIDGRWHTYDSDALRRSKYKFGGEAGYSAFYTAADGGMTAAEATALADEAKGWNTTFKRRNVRSVRKLVRDMLRTPL